MQEIEIRRIIKKTNTSALPGETREETYLWGVLKGPHLHNNANGCASGKTGIHKGYLLSPQRPGFLGEVSREVRKKVCIDEGRRHRLFQN